MKLVKRDSGAVYAALLDVPDKPVIAKAPLSILCPVRFREIGLAQIGNPCFVFGLFPIVLGDGTYGLMNVNALFELGPCRIEMTEIDESSYYLFQFQKGDTVFQTKQLVARANLIFKALDEFFFKGKVPFYVGYEDKGRIFDTAKKHAGTNATIIPSVTEWMTAFTARKASDKLKYIREDATSYQDFGLSKLAWVPMSSIYYSTIGTVNKLAGAYFQDGVISAIVNPSDRVENVESVLRA